MSCIIHGAKARPQTASIEVFKSIWHGRPKGGLVENPGLSRRLLRRPYVGHGGLRLAMADPARHPTGIRRSPQRLERVSGIEPPSSAWKAVALPLSYTRERHNKPDRDRAPNPIGIGRLCHLRREPNDFNKIS
jgi:hypothetical protein